MTQTRSLIWLSLAWLLLVGGSGWNDTRLDSQQAAGRMKQPEQTQTSQEQASGTAPLPLAPPPGLRSFAGRVEKVGNRYVLEDALLGARYEIDPQEAVRVFEGMMVRLNGALDPTGKIIHLEHPLR